MRQPFHVPSQPARRSPDRVAVCADAGTLSRRSRCARDSGHLTGGDRPPTPAEPRVRPFFEAPINSEGNRYRSTLEIPALPAEPVSSAPGRGPAGTFGSGVLVRRHLRVSQGSESRLSAILPATVNPSSCRVRLGHRLCATADEKASRLAPRHLPFVAFANRRGTGVGTDAPKRRFGSVSGETLGGQTADIAYSWPHSCITGDITTEQPSEPTRRR